MLNPIVHDFEVYLAIACVVVAPILILLVVWLFDGLHATPDYKAWSAAFDEHLGLHAIDEGADGVASQQQPKGPIGPYKTYAPEWFKEAYAAIDAERPVGDVRPSANGEWVECGLDHGHPDGDKTVAYDAERPVEAEVKVKNFVATTIGPDNYPNWVEVPPSAATGLDQVEALAAANVQAGIDASPYEPDAAVDDKLADNEEPLWELHVKVASTDKLRDHLARRESDLKHAEDMLAAKRSDCDRLLAQLDPEAVAQAMRAAADARTRLDKAFEAIEQERSEMDAKLRKRIAEVTSHYERKLARLSKSKTRKPARA